MKSLFISMLALLTSIQLVAQDNFLPGKIITTKGDTLHGKINCWNWDQNPTFIEFFNKETQDIVIYQASEVQSFNVAGEVYHGCKIEVETSSREIGWMTSNPKLKFKSKVVFLKELFDGPKSLYHYKDNKDVDFFYIKMDSTYKLLMYKQMLDYSNGKDNVRESKKYIGQLLYYLNDRPDLQGLINKTLYTKSSLLKVFYAYAPKHSRTMQYEATNRRTTMSYGVTLGLSQNLLTFTGDGFPELCNGVQKPPITLSPGFFIEIGEPGNLGRWSLYNEVNTAFYRFQSNYSNTLYHYETKLDLDYLRLNSMLRYKVMMNKGYLFIGGGLSYGYTFFVYNVQQWTSKIDPLRVETHVALIDPSRLESGIAFSVGAASKNFFLESRTIVGNGPSSYSNLKSLTVSTNLLVGYRF